MTASLPTTSADQATRSPAWQPWIWLLLYFGAQLLSRVLVSNALELDEAEQTLWTQQLQAGYGAQPPLYTWLQWSVFQVFSVSVFSLALLKNLLLALTYTFVFLAARVVVAPPLALAASACMLLLPQIGWESQRDLTHSVLVTTLAAATLYVVVQLLLRPRPALYLALGLVAGLGVLAKYSYVGFIVALGLALLTGRDTRKVLLDPWIIAAALLALAIVTPHALWLLDHWRQAAQGTVDKLGSQEAVTRAGRAALGLGSLLFAILEFVGLWVVVMLAVFGRSIWHRSPSPQGPMSDARLPDTGKLWARYAIVLAVLFGGMVLLGDVTKFKDRWMQPFLFVVPLVFFTCSPQLARHPRLGLLPRILAGVAILLVVLIALRTPVAAWRGRFDELNFPMPELARTLRQHGYDGRATIFTSERVLGGALRLQFPQATVRVARNDPVPPNDRPLLVVDSIAGPHAGTVALDATQAIAAGQPIMDTALPYRYARPGSELARYRYRLIE